MTRPTPTTENPAAPPVPAPTVGVAGHLPRFVPRLGPENLDTRCPACGRFEPVDEATGLDLGCWRIVVLLGSVLRGMRDEEGW